MIPSDHWKQRLQQTPELIPYLKPIAKKWAKGLPLPKRMTLGAEPKEPAVRSALDRMFGSIAYAKGKVSANIPDALRDEKILSELAAELGIERKVIKKSTAATSILRLRLSHPNLNKIHEWLADSKEIERLLTKEPKQEVLLQNLLETADFLLLEEKTITLSKLGSMFFNDSKLLRSGTPRKILGGMMNCQLSAEDTAENREIALQQFGVIDNPATTTVTLFAPIDLIRNGKPDRWIVDRFNEGEPVTLNSYNLEGVEAIKLRPGYDTVITSENAAPFHDLIVEHPKAILIYTGGYPNAAVCRMLRLLSEAGATNRHWGDTDPDGFMIAALINRYIKTSLLRCGTEDVLRQQEDLKPLDNTKITRAQYILKTQPDFIFHKELSLTLRLGGWLEQERSATPSSL